MLERKTLLQNRYRIHEVLNNKGGMGVIYLAEDERLNRRVVVKESKLAQHQPEVHEKLLRSFRREARLLAEVKHLGLVRSSDLFTENESHFLVMDYVEGDDLEELLQRQLTQTGQPFPLADVLAWADRLLDALQHLHQQPSPIIHNDIKPANLKLTPQGAIILLDFGLAQSVALGGQASTVAGFTRDYASYEQIQGKDTDARSDLFSLAATLYHLLTGRSPVDAPTRMKALADGQSDPLLPAHLVHPQVPPAVSRVLHWALSLPEGKRPPTAQAFRQALWECRQRTTPSVSLPRQVEAATIVRLSNIADARPTHSPDATRWHPVYAAALRLVLEAGHGSAAVLQQQLSLNVEQARALLERLRREGVLEPATDTVQLPVERRAKLLALAIRQQTAYVERRSSVASGSLRQPTPPSSASSLGPGPARAVRIEVPLVAARQPAAPPPATHRPRPNLGEKLVRGLDQRGTEIWQKLLWLGATLWQQSNTSWQALQAWYHRQGRLHIPKDVKGFLLLVFGVLVLLSLVSYDPGDLKNDPGIQAKSLNNWLGSIGAHLARYLYGTFGWLSYLTPGSLLLLGWYVLRPWKVVSPLASLFGWLLILFGIVGLLAIADLNGPTDDDYFRAGVIGRVQLARFLVAALAVPGATLSLLAVLMIGFGIAKPASFKHGLHLALTLLAKLATSCWFALTVYLETRILKNNPNVRQSNSAKHNLANSDNLSADNQSNPVAPEDDWVDFELDQPRR